MKIAMISCWKYRDAWKPFFALLDKFWPDCPYEKCLISDYVEPDAIPPGVKSWWISYRGGWCDVLMNFATMAPTEAMLLFQEDFFLTAPVRADKIARGLEQMEKTGAGCVRLYPMPGADIDYGDSDFGVIPVGTPYRASCQAAIWCPSYLREIASVGGEAMHFEINGTLRSNELPDPVLAWKREVQPWPLEYICSGITKGRWNPDSKRLFEQHGIEADYSLRAFA